MKNLRDFLGYLENKGIINPTKLQNKDEMKILLKDIMKLDLTKFSKPRNNSEPIAPDQKRRIHPSPVMSQVRTPAEQMSITEHTFTPDGQRPNSLKPTYKGSSQRVRTEVSKENSNERSNAYINADQKGGKKYALMI